MSLAFMAGSLAAYGQDPPPAVDQPKPPGQTPRIEVEVPRPEQTAATPPSRVEQTQLGVAGAFSTDVEGPFLPDVQGTHIYSGKKTENIDLDKLPPIVNSNFREAFAKTPGLILAEESNPLFSVGYRGLPPDRGQYMQILQDGIPITADMVGYPEAYYVPPLDFVQRIDFIHGGSGLMYGPQPGGALNFVMRDPNPDVGFSFFTQDVLGTHDLFSTSNAISGTVGPVGYYSYLHHRESNGFRTANSDYAVNYGGAKIITQLSPTARTILSFNALDQRIQEPGGLTLADFAAGSVVATRLNDKFQLKRYNAWIGYQEEIYPDLLFEAKAWATYYDRFSRRQTGGGFGTPALGATSTFQSQIFRTFGAESRMRRDWGSEGQHTFTGGMLFNHTDSPRTDSTGPATFDAGTTVTGSNERELNYYSLFAENRFVRGRWSLTPGVRIENIWQGVTEQVNAARTLAGLPLQDVDDYDAVPLFGAGLAYEWNDQTQIYSNLSQAYRPKVFTQTIVAAPNQVVAGDLAPGDSWQFEVGARGTPTPWLQWDTSLFYMEFTDQIGLVAGVPVSVLTNVGDAYYRGAETFGQVDLTGMTDQLLGTNAAGRFGSFSVFAGGMYLDAQFYKGLPAVVGKSPQYAPNYQLKYGMTYARDRTLIQLAATVVDDQFANDSHTPEFFIPNYHVWDLTTNLQVYGRMSIVAGVNNLFDEHYYARVTATGIDPTDGTNYYLGGRLDY